VLRGKKHQHEPVVLGEVEEVVRVEGREWQLSGQAARGDPRLSPDSRRQVPRSSRGEATPPVPSPAKSSLAFTGQSGVQRSRGEDPSAREALAANGASPSSAPANMASPSSQNVTLKAVARRDAASGKRYVVVAQPESRSSRWGVRERSIVGVRGKMDNADAERFQ